MDLIATITVSSEVGSMVSSILTNSGAEGIMQTVTQQLGLGLMLSALLITVPPMAGVWFNGVMGNSYSGYNALQGWGSKQLPATPLGMNSTEANAMAQSTSQDRSSNVNNNPYINQGSWANSQSQGSDQLKSSSVIGGKQS